MTLMASSTTAVGRARLALSPDEPLAVAGEAPAAGVASPLALPLVADFDFAPDDDDDDDAAAVDVEDSLRTSSRTRRRRSE